MRDDRRRHDDNRRTRDQRMTKNTEHHNYSSAGLPTASPQSISGFLERATGAPVGSPGADRGIGTGELT